MLKEKTNSRDKPKMRMKEINRNNKLAAAARDGDAQAQEELVLRNRGLIHRIANIYARNDGEKEDLFQEGVCGLIRAAKSYDESKGSFTTYASIWIRAAVLKNLRNQEDFHYNDAFYGKYLRYRKLKAACGREDDDFRETELKDYNLTRADIRTIQKYARQSCSLEDLSESQICGKSREAAISAGESLEDEVIRKELQFMVRSEIERLLSPKEMFVIRHAYGIADETPEKMTKIAKMLAEEFSCKVYSRQRIQQIRTSAEKKLKESPMLQSLAEE